MPATLNRKFHVGQNRGHARYKQGNENPQSETIVKKRNQFLLLEMMATDWVTFGVDREIPLWPLLATH